MILEWVDLLSSVGGLLGENQVSQRCQRCPGLILGHFQNRRPIPTPFAATLDLVLLLNPFLLSSAFGLKPAVIQIQMIPLPHFYPRKNLRGGTKQPLNLCATMGSGFLNFS